MRESIEIIVALTFDADADLSLEEQTANCLNDIARLHDADSTTGVELTNVEILDQRSEHDVVSQRAVTLVLHAPMPDLLARYADDRVDSEGAPCPCLNHYKCQCGEVWNDQWSCTCDDRCPSCNTSIEPLSSDVLITKDQAQPLAFELRMMGAVNGALELLLSEMNEPDFEPGHGMTARDLVHPILATDLEALIANTTARYNILRSIFVMQQPSLKTQPTTEKTTFTEDVLALERALKGD